MTHPPRILVVDDEASMREMISILLKRQGYEVVTANSGHQASEILDADTAFELIITDLLMDRGGGLELLDRVKSQQLQCEVILITAYGTAESAVEAMKKGAFDYVTKPFNVDEFLIIVRQAIERLQLIRENLDLKARVRGEYRFADIIGRSPAMKAVISLCRKVADSPSTVLISGESGTGKELVARALHFGGQRAQKPFVAINCGALPEQLMESELFGHVKGAFTGATEDKQGLFRAADGGSIFLDEVGELPMPLQVKMLRVLQNHLVRPIGCAEEQPVDVRVIAATNRELEGQVEQGQFRRDLFYRLNVFQIKVPPLRERREDLAPLVEHLLERHAVGSAGALRKIAPSALRALMAHDFPGNVRELANIIERASVLATTDQIAVEDLPPEVQQRDGPTASHAQRLPEEGIDLDQTLELIERSLIEQALERTGGVRKAAAALLGITFRSLRYRLQKLGWDQPENETN